MSGESLEIDSELWHAKVAECERLKAESDALHDIASVLYGEAEWEPADLHGRVVELLDERDALKAALHDAEAIGDFSEELRDRLALKEAAACVPTLLDERDRILRAASVAIKMLESDASREERAAAFYALQECFDGRWPDPIEVENAQLRADLAALHEKHNIAAVRLEQHALDLAAMTAKRDALFEDATAMGRKLAASEARWERLTKMLPATALAVVDREMLDAQRARAGDGPSGEGAR